MNLRVHDIIEGTTVDGPGFRTSIYFAGCPHRCQGCHNPQTWDPGGGEEKSIDDIVDFIVEAENDVTLSGGDPLYQYRGVEELCCKLKALGFGVWLYTGYTFDQLKDDSKYARVLQNIDVLVDGPFIEELRDTSLLFRGSSNQRLIDIRKTIDNGGEIVLWQSDF